MNNQTAGLRFIDWIVVLLPVLTIFYLSRNNLLFWDTVQFAGKHPNFYLNTHFSKLLLPDDLDSGHVPIFGLYIALFWKCLGKDIVVSHLSMLPFIFGIFYQSLRLFKHFFPSPNYFFPFIIFIIDPTLLGQIILVSPDLVLIFLFLLALNSILFEQKTSLLVAGFFLALISTRGIMVLAALTLFNIYKNGGKSFNIIELIKKSLWVVPGLVIFTIYQYHHYIEKTWIFFHPSSPWAPCFKVADIFGKLKNGFILFWRWMDFGRAIIGVVFLYYFFQKRKELFKNNDIKDFSILLLLMTIMLSITFIRYEGLNGHRYILPTILISNVLLSFIIGHFVKQKLLINCIIICCLVLGNFIFYPKSISQGWDASLAHIGYYKGIENVIHHLEENNIEPVTVFTTFPHLATFDEIGINGNFNHFSAFDSNIEMKYILVSNFASIQVLDLPKDYIEVYSNSKFGSNFILFQKNYYNKSNKIRN
jgi:hypothetical protein